MSDRYRQLKEYYDEFESHPMEARRVAWRGQDDQHLRIQVLLEAIDEVDYPVSVLDVGCGLGALYGILKDSGRLGEYLGLDLLPSMIKQARINHPDGNFEVRDLLEWEGERRFDLVVCSGALNVKVPKHAIWVQHMLQAMWERCELAVATNFQTTRAMRFNPIAKYDQDIFHGDRATLMAWCEKLTPWVALRQDYLGDDASFYLYRNYHRSCRRREKDRSSDHRTAEEQACGLAFLYLERSMPRAGLKVLKDVEDTAQVLNYRGLCHHRLKQYARARAYYSGALELDPNHNEARLNLDWISKNTK